MDRSEMLFLAALECWKDGLASDECAARAARLIEALDKAHPDYVDPEALENVIQDRLKKERNEIRKAIEIQLTNGIPTGRGAVESLPMLDRPGYTLRFSWESARALAEKVVP